MEDTALLRAIYLKLPPPLNISDTKKSLNKSYAEIDVLSNGVLIIAHLYAIF